MRTAAAICLALSVPIDYSAPIDLASIPLRVATETREKKQQEHAKTKQDECWRRRTLLVVGSFAKCAAERSLYVIFGASHAHGPPAIGKRVGLVVKYFAVVIAFGAPPRRVAAADTFRFVKARVERVPFSVGICRIHSPPTRLYYREPCGRSFVAESSVVAVYAHEC